MIYNDDKISDTFKENYAVMNVEIDCDADANGYLSYERIECSKLSIKTLSTFLITLMLLLVTLVLTDKVLSWISPNQ